jgi:hypothetical protein
MLPQVDETVTPLKQSDRCGPTRSIVKSQVDTEDKSAALTLDTYADLFPDDLAAAAAAAAAAVAAAADALAAAAYPLRAGQQQRPYPANRVGPLNCTEHWSG